MKSRAVVSTLAAAALVAFVMLASGCGGSSSSGNQVTNPPPTVEPFESGNVLNGQTFVHVFATEGSFGYRCRIHGGMTGTATVAAGGADSAVITITGVNAFPAPGVGSFPIHAGGYVRWINNGTTHTVSRP
jgi:plastocyanin